LACFPCFAEEIFSDLHGVGDRAAAGLRDQQVNMLRHDHKSIDLHAIKDPCALQRTDKQISKGWIGEVRKPVVTGEGDEVRRMRITETIQSSWHGLV